MELEHGFALTLQRVMESGEVECPAKGVMGRDRCVSYQLRRVCGCELGDEVRRVAMRHRTWEAERDHKRLIGAERAGRWVIECRTCGGVFTVKAGFWRKPVYCSKDCALVSYGRRRRMAG